MLLYFFSATFLLQLLHTCSILLYQWHMYGKQGTASRHIQPAQILSFLHQLLLFHPVLVDTGKG